MLLRQLQVSCLHRVELGHKLIYLARTYGTSVFGIRYSFKMACSGGEISMYLNLLVGNGLWNDLCVLRSRSSAVLQAVYLTLANPTVAAPLPSVMLILLPDFPSSSLRNQPAPTMSSFSTLDGHVRVWGRFSLTHGFCECSKPTEKTN